MQHSQNEIDKFWSDVSTGKYNRAIEQNPDTIRARILVDDKVAQVISIIINDGFGEVIYGRRPNSEWQEIQ